MKDLGHSSVAIVPDISYVKTSTGSVHRHAIRSGWGAYQLSGVAETGPKSTVMRRGVMRTASGACLRMGMRRQAYASARVKQNRPTKRQNRPRFRKQTQISEGVKRLKARRYTSCRSDVVQPLEVRVDLHRMARVHCKAFISPVLATLMYANVVLCECRGCFECDITYRLSALHLTSAQCQRRLRRSICAVVRGRIPSSNACRCRVRASRGRRGMAAQPASFSSRPVPEEVRRGTWCRTAAHER